MTKIKFCGLKTAEDIAAANELLPEYIGFVFAKKSKRYITTEQAAALKRRLDPRIQAVGVFVNEKAENIISLLNSGIIDIAQLHGDETEELISEIRSATGKCVIKAFKMTFPEDAVRANGCGADFVLLDSAQAGSGTVFNWDILKNVNRPYFLAGGLDTLNIRAALELAPYAVDVSSGIETDGHKDKNKMAAFTAAVRKEENA